MRSWWWCLLEAGELNKLLRSSEMLDRGTKRAVL